MKNLLTAIRSASVESETRTEVRNIRLLDKGVCLTVAGVAYLLGGPVVGFVATVVLFVLF
jgi:hypothetical protein